MTEERYLELAKAEFARLKELHKHNNFYDYEKSFDNIWTGFGRNVLQELISESGKDHRKKTLSAPDTEK